MLDPVKFDTINLILVNGNDVIIVYLSLILGSNRAKLVQMVF